MESVGVPDSCIVEETTTLIIDAACVARRKRREIRRFKKMCSPRNAPQGILKRSRPVSGGPCDSCDGEEDDLKSKTDEDVPVSSQLLAEIKVSSGNPLLRGSGLARSKSFPPQGWHSKCILRISKTSRICTATGLEARLSVVSEDHGSTLSDNQPGVGSTWAPEVDRPPVLSASVAEGGEVEAKELVIQQTANYQPEPKSEVSSAVETFSDPMVEEAPKRLLTGSSSSKASAKEICSSASEGRASPHRCWSDGRCPPSGKLMVCGRRREMEDTAAIVPSFAVLPCNTMRGCERTTDHEDKAFSDLHFFAVYDGHGGSQASNYCVERLHQALADELTKLSLGDETKGNPENGWGSQWEKVMTSCFSRMDKEIGGVCPNGECEDVDSSSTCCVDTIAPDNVGTTAVVAVVGSCQLVIANCGDSRAVLSRGGKAIPLSRDHKPERDDETTRIEAAGGRIIYWDGYRVGGLLAISRAIGDRYLKRYVVSEPEVTCIQRTEEDECLILASDGLWDVISNDVACEIARKYLANARRKSGSGIHPPGEDPASAQVAALLVKLAYGRGSKDNISVVVVDLKARNTR